MLISSSDPRQPPALFLSPLPLFPLIQAEPLGSREIAPRFLPLRGRSAALSFDSSGYQRGTKAGIPPPLINAITARRGKLAGVFATLMVPGISAIWREKKKRFYEFNLAECIIAVNIPCKMIYIENFFPVRSFSRRTNFSSRLIIQFCAREDV